MSIRLERHPAARRVVALFALAFAVLFALPASAGALHTTDDAGVLTPSQLAAVRSRAQGCDFDVRVITTSSYASKSDLGNYVHRFVTEPNLVVIGLDPVHRHVSVHFGTGTRIADSEFKAIESAGVASFKDGDWAGGVDAILDRAEKAVGTGGGRRAPAGGTAAPASESGGGLGLFGIVAIVGVLGLVVWLVARRRSSGPVGGYGPPMGGGPPMRGGYGMPPTGPQYGGGSGMGGNIVSAGLGGLVGFTRSARRSGEGHHRRDDDGPPRWQGGSGAPARLSAGGDSAEPGNYDAGGARRRL